MHSLAYEIFHFQIIQLVINAEIAITDFSFTCAHFRKVVRMEKCCVFVFLLFYVCYDSNEMNAIVSLLSTV